MKNNYTALYSAYCRYHGNTPKQQFKKDKEKWPGGLMCGYILWIADLKQKFYKAHPEFFLDKYTIHNTKEWVNFVVNYK